MNVKKLSNLILLSFLQNFCFNFLFYPMEERENKQTVWRSNCMAAAYIARKKNKQIDYIIEFRIFPQKLSSALFALFDEPETNGISQYLAENLTQIIVRQAKGGRSDYDNIIKESLAIIDYKLEEERKTGWCSVILALKVDNTLFIATVGDSKAILSRNSKALDLSFYHLPTDDIERKRIKNTGGIIIQEAQISKLEGIYPVSRAIGDFFMKRKGLIAIPDIKIVEIQEEDNLLILACNGILNQGGISNLDQQHLIDIANHILQTHKDDSKSTEIIAETLMETACKSSDENLNLITILFNQRECLAIRVKKANLIKNKIDKLANKIEKYITLLTDSLKTDNNFYNICAKLLKRTLKKIEDNVNHLTFSIYNQKKVINELTNEFNAFLSVKRTIDETYKDVDFKTQLQTNIEDREEFCKQIELKLSELKSLLETIKLNFQKTIKHISQIIQ